MVVKVKLMLIDHYGSNHSAFYFVGQLVWPKEKPFIICMREHVKGVVHVR